MPYKSTAAADFAQRHSDDRASHVNDDTMEAHIPGRPTLSWHAGVLVGVACLVAACGGTPSTPGIASIGSTTSTTVAAGTAASPGGPSNLQQAYEAQLAYAECMRSHGEPSYPDPTLTAHSLSQSTKGVDTSTPQFLSASTACKKLIPNGGPPSQAQIEKMVASALKHSECMRAHGVPNFPDPVVGDGGVSIRIGGPGLDPSSPQFQNAQKVCQKLAPLGGGG
jgi:hypothetical protein